MARKAIYIHGLRPSAPPPVVRWLGAFAFAREWESLAKFELAPGRPVSAEPIFFGKSGILRYKKFVSVGLLVDPTDTNLVKGYRTDAWTPNSRHHGGNRVVPAVKSWDQLMALKPHKNCGERWGEVLLSNPKYSAIVLADESGREFAEYLASMMGLPIIDWGKIEDWRAFDMKG